MNLEQRVMDGLKAAMKSKDQAAMRTLRAIKSAILLFKTSGKNEELDDAAELRLLQKLVKQRRESAQIYHEQGREDLAQPEEEEIAILETFLPKQLDEEELKQHLSALIDELGATSPQDMGKVMGVATKQLAGQADGRLISTIVRQLLTS